MSVKSGAGIAADKAEARPTADHAASGSDEGHRSDPLHHGSPDIAQLLHHISTGYER